MIDLHCSDGARTELIVASWARSCGGEDASDGAVAGDGGTERTGRNGWICMARAPLKCVIFRLVARATNENRARAGARPFERREKRRNASADRRAAQLAEEAQRGRPIGQPRHCPS